MTDKNPLAHYSGVLSEAVQDSAAATGKAVQPNFMSHSGGRTVTLHFADDEAALNFYRAADHGVMPALAAPPAVTVPDFENWRKREYPWLGPIGDGVQIAREAWSAALAATPAAAAPVVLPEPIGEICSMRDELGAFFGGPVPDLGTKLYTDQQVRPLLAGVSAPAAQAVASIYVTADGQRECDDWNVSVPIGRNLLYTAPQAQADARDADGEAFRTAARLGLTLRFYGNCAQSGMPGAPSVYEVTPGPNNAEAMRASIARADAAIAAQAAQQGGAA